MVIITALLRAVRPRLRERCPRGCLICYPPFNSEGAMHWWPGPGYREEP